MSDFIERAMVQGKVDASKLMKPMVKLAPRIDSIVTRICTISNVNRTVHLPTYNTIILAEALKLKRNGN